MATLLLDANLLVLLAVGNLGPESINSHRRLSAYDDEDYWLLTDVLQRFSSFATCPNVATEASNLIRFSDRDGRYALSLKAIIDRLEEVHVPSVVAGERPEYRRLGYTDAVLLCMGRPDLLLVTADLDLHLAAENAGLNSFNFNYLRDGAASLP